MRGRSLGKETEMRSLWNSLLAAVVIAVATRAALAVEPPSTSPADEPVRAALRKLIPMYEQAVSSEDIDPEKDNLETLRPYLSPDFSAVMVTSREVHSFDEMRKFWRDMKANYIGKGGKYRVSVKPEPSIVMGDVVVTRGTADETVVSDRGREFKYTSEWTAVFRRDPAAKADDPAGQWRIVRLHASMDPVYNDFTALQSRVWKWVALAAGVVALAVLVVVFMASRRRRAGGASPSEVGRV
jgi:ketosteroid isomerase-like protein